MPDILIFKYIIKRKKHPLLTIDFIYNTIIADKLFKYL